VSDLLSVADLGADGLAAVVALAADVKREPDRVRGALAGRSIGLYFEKPSLRTWVSSDVAAADLGMHTVLIREDQTGLGTRESLEDVGRVLDRYLDALAMRVFSHSDLARVADVMAGPVVNLLSDREHPCQAVADLVTIAEHRPLAGARVAFVGDGNNVCHSLALGVALSGGSLAVAAPPGHEPAADVLARARESGEVTVGEDPADAVRGADVVYTDVWASMGQESEAEDRRRRFAGYRVDSRLFDLAAPDAIFLHCLPAHRGEEVTAEVLEHPRSRVFDQAENRLHAFKAILLHLLG